MNHEGERLKRKFKNKSRRRNLLLSICVSFGGLNLAPDGSVLGKLKVQNSVWVFEKTVISCKCFQS